MLFSQLLVGVDIDLALTGTFANEYECLFLGEKQIADAAVVLTSSFQELFVYGMS